MAILNPQQAAANRLASGASTINTALPPSPKPMANFNVQAPNPTVQPNVAQSNPAAPAQIKPLVRPQAPITNRITNYGQLSNAQYTSQPNNPVSPQKPSIAQNGSQVASQLPGQTLNGAFDPGYIPKSEEEALNPAYDKYTSNKYLANYYNSKGIKFDSSKLPGSFEDEANQFLGQQDKQKTLLDEQIEASKAKINRQAAGQQDALTAQLAPNREGIVSAGNAMGLQQGINQIASDATLQVNQLDSQEQQLNQQLQDNQKNFIAGREEQIRSQLAAVQAQKAKVIDAQNQQQQQSNTLLSILDKSGALANLSPEDQAFIQQGMPGVPPGIVQAMSHAATRNVGTQQQQAKQEAETAALNNVKGIAELGVEITPQMAQQFAQQTGLPTDSFLNYNTAVQQIQQNKTLDAASKAQLIQEQSLKLNQEQQGIWNTAQQNTSFLSNMYKNGASPEMISAFKSAAGIADTSDPMYQAKLQYQSAQTDNERINAYTNSLDAGLNPGTYISTNGSYDMSIDPKTGSLNLQPPNGSKAGQCGHYVNQVCGAQIMGNSYTGKLAKCDKNIGFGTGQNPPTPGMFFVMPVTGQSSGHTGMYLGVQPKDATLPDGTQLHAGQALVKDSNWHNDETVHTHTIPFNQIKGFGSPPNSQVVGTSNNPASMNDQQILSAYQEAGKTFDTPKAARQAIVTARQTGFIPGAKDANGDLTANAQQLISGKMSFDDFGKKNNASFANEVTKIDPSFNLGAAKRYLQQMEDKSQGIAKNSSIPMAQSASKLLDDVNNISQDLVKKGIIGNTTVLNDAGISALISSGQGGPDVQKQLGELRTKLAGAKGQVATVISGGFAPNEGTVKDINDALRAGVNPDFLSGSVQGFKDEMAGRVEAQSDYSYITPPKVSDNPDIQAKFVQNAMGQFGVDQGSDDSNSGLQTHGDFKSNIQKMVDSGTIHTTTIVKELRDNPGTKAWVENALLNGGTPQEIVNLYLQNS